MIYFGGYQGKIVFLELKEEEEKIHRKPSTDNWTIHPARRVWQQRHLEVGSCCLFFITLPVGGEGYGIRCNSDEAMESTTMDVFLFLV